MYSAQFVLFFLVFIIYTTQRQLLQYTIFYYFCTILSTIHFSAFYTSVNRQMSFLTVKQGLFKQFPSFQMSITCHFTPSQQNKQLFLFSYKIIYFFLIPMSNSLKMAYFQRNLFLSHDSREIFQRKPLLKMSFQHNISALLSAPSVFLVLQHFEIFCSNIISLLFRSYFAAISYKTTPPVFKYIS